MLQRVSTTKRPARSEFTSSEATSQHAVTTRQPQPQLQPVTFHPRRATGSAIAYHAFKRSRLADQINEAKGVLAKHRTSPTAPTHSELQSVKEDLKISEGLVARHEETIADVNEKLAKRDEACKEACNALRVVEIHMHELKGDLHEQKRMLGNETKARMAWQQRATDLANTSKTLEQTYATNRLWEQRSKALYEMLLEEIKSAHRGNDEALAEITASLHDTFGQHIEKHKAAE